MSLLPAWLSQRAALSPQQVALLTGDGQSWTFAQMLHIATSLSVALRTRGVQPGERVAVLLPNIPLYVWLIHALPLLDAVLVPLNLRLTAAELGWQLNDVRATWLVAETDDVTSAVCALAPLARHLAAADLLQAAATPVPALVPAPPVDLDALHTIIYTSGTTGTPKGVCLTYGNHWWSAIGSALNLGYQTDDRWLACLPLFHVGGLSILLKGVIYGMPVLLLPRFDAAVVNRAIVQHRISVISVVAVMLQRMLDQRSDHPYPPHLRCVLLGGGPAPLPLLERCAAATVPVVQTYGLTETASQAVTLAPADALRKLGAAGKPLFPVEVRVVDEAGHDQPAAVAGDILVRGPIVTPGYDHLPSASAARLRDGWLWTGDVGLLDAEGYLIILDRRDDLIISGGENIYPAEIEAVLQAHPAVAEAGVRGRADATWGQRPVATIVLRDGGAASTEEILAHCRAQLAPYKVPVAIHSAALLPRNAAGKLLRRALPE